MYFVVDFARKCLLIDFDFGSINQAVRLELKIIFEFDFTITAKQIILELGIDYYFIIVDGKVVSNIDN